MGSGIKHFAATAVALATCGLAGASENYDLRYAPGDGGADMSAPFEAGWVFQMPVYVYSAHVDHTTAVPTDLTAAPFGLPIPGATATSDITTRLHVNVQALLPRLSFMSSVSVLGGTLGGTALLPIVNKRAEVSVRNVTTSVNAPGLPAANAAVIGGLINQAAGVQGTELADGNSNSSTGVGDLELSPIIRWATDRTQTLFVATVILPTGGFRPDRAANPSAGRFYTFRPAVQWSYIGDGWDFGARGAFSINTIDTLTHYKTGDYLNVDATLMKSLSDSTRFGLAGYAVDQTTRDSRDRTPADPILNARQEATLGEKGHVYGLGPELAYIHGAGDFLLDGRVVKEFGASDRPEGISFWVTLSKPF